jgi:hypothetical protein
MVLGAAHAAVMNSDDFHFISFVAKNNKSYKTVDEYNMRA